MNWTVAVERKRSSKSHHVPTYSIQPLSLDTFPDVFQALLRPIRSRTDEDFPRMDIDVTEAGDKYVLKAELPGVEKRTSRSK